MTTQVTRVSGNKIILEQNIFPVPVSGDIIYKEPVLGAYFGNTKMILNRDFTITNTSEAIIEIDEKAEFYLAKEKITTNTPGQPSVTFVFNPEPSYSKTFHTLNYEGSAGWALTDLTTDYNSAFPITSATLTYSLIDLEDQLFKNNFNF